MKGFMLSHLIRFPAYCNPARYLSRSFSEGLPVAKLERIYLHVNPKNKRQVIEAGATWDHVARKWYVYKDTPALEKCIQFHRTYFSEPHDERYRPNKFARWDHTEKKWYSVGNYVFENPYERISEKVSVKSIEPHHKVYVFDIESNGLPDETKPLEDDSRYNTSRIVQMSGLLCNCSDLSPVGGGNPTASVDNVIVRYDGFSIDNANIHGITPERSMTEGLPFKRAIEQLKPKLMQAQYFLAHNAAFDMPVLRSELIRYGEEELLKHVDSMTVVCSMMKTTSLLRLRGRSLYRYKYPSMKELYHFATGEEIANQHDAMHDVLNLHRAVNKLVDNGRVEVDEFFNAVITPEENRIFA